MTEEMEREKDIEESQLTTVIAPPFRYLARALTLVDFQKQNCVLVLF
jgi:hypothetical protein